MRLPFVAAPGWWVGARCRTERVPLSTFFDRERVDEARAVCRDCPVRARCLVEHVEEPFGVWGGHARDERARIRAMMDTGTRLADASRTIDARRPR